MNPSLFNCPDSKPLSWDTPTVVSTPLGTLGFEAVIDEVDVCGLGPSSVSQTPTGGCLFRWLIDQFQAELLLAPITPTLPEGWSVDGCWAGVWRVRAATRAEEVEFRCEWAPGHTWLEGGPDSGQYLDAWTWDDGSVQVTVGTEDAEALAHRAAREAGLPSRWAEMIEPRGQGVKDTFGVTDAGLRLSFPDLAEGETCQAAFLVAWAPAPPTREAAQSDGRYISTWLAVQETPEKSLASAGLIET